ncbi:MAG: Ig-like domain-containing protein [Firmicutes bacterium]|nr:Ig-like domain-containing protein [Bacillota bacterium]
MKKLRKILLLSTLTAVCVLAALLSACAQQLTGLVIICDELTEDNVLTLEVGEVRTLGVEFYPASNTLSKEIDWTVAASPKGCVTVDDSGNVTALKPGVAVVTAKVTTKFGPVFASCEVSVAGDSIQEALPAALVAVLNRLAPSGVSNEEALNEDYFAAWTNAQVDAWNAESEVTSDYELVLGAYRVQKGLFEGAIIVKTATTGYWSYYENDPDSGLIPHLVLYTAIDKDGKFIGMNVADMGEEDFYSADNFAGLNLEIIGKSFVGKSIDDIYDYVDEFTDMGFFTVIPEKVDSFAGATIRPYYTSFAFIQAMTLATEVFVAMQ